MRVRVAYGPLEPVTSTTDLLGFIILTVRINLVIWMVHVGQQSLAYFEIDIFNLGGQKRNLNKLQ